jgi:hypothetical protein
LGNWGIGELVNWGIGVGDHSHRWFMHAMRVRFWGKAFRVKGLGF